MTCMLVQYCSFVDALRVGLQMVEKERDDPSGSIEDHLGNCNTWILTDDYTYIVDAVVQVMDGSECIITQLLK